MERRAAEQLVGALREMLTELAAATDDGDVGWLRPLAVLTAEIEYSALRRPTVDSNNLADECRELSELLAGFVRSARSSAWTISSMSRRPRDRIGFAPMMAR
jgi:hypothetical protein